MGVNTYDDVFGNKQNNKPGFIQKFIHYGLGLSRIAGGVAEGLSGNPAGFVEAGQQAMGMVKDKIDGRL